MWHGRFTQLTEHPDDHFIRVEAISTGRRITVEAADGAPPFKAHLPAEVFDFLLKHKLVYEQETHGNSSIFYLTETALRDAEKLGWRRPRDVLDVVVSACERVFGRASTGKNLDQLIQLLGP
jgi:hypothetical protein